MADIKDIPLLSGEVEKFKAIVAKINEGGGGEGVTALEGALEALELRVAALEGL